MGKNLTVRLGTILLVAIFGTMLSGGCKMFKNKEVKGVGGTAVGGAAAHGGTGIAH
jgi:hypothetical protein